MYNKVSPYNLRYYMCPTPEDHRTFETHFKNMAKTAHLLSCIMTIVGLLLLITVVLIIVFVGQEDAKVVSLVFAIVGIFLPTAAYVVEFGMKKPLNMIRNSRYTFVECKAYNPQSRSRGDSITFYANIRDNFDNEMDSKMNIDRATYNYLLRNNEIAGKLLRFNDKYMFLTEESMRNPRNSSFSIVKLS